MANARYFKLHHSVTLLFESGVEINELHDNKKTNKRQSCKDVLKKGEDLEKFAWSAFQNSPEPEDLPIPSNEWLSEIIRC